MKSPDKFDSQRSCSWWQRGVANQTDQVTNTSSNVLYSKQHPHFSRTQKKEGLQECRNGKTSKVQRKYLPLALPQSKWHCPFRALLTHICRNVLNKHSARNKQNRLRNKKVSLNGNTSLLRRLVGSTRIDSCQSHNIAMGFKWRLKVKNLRFIPDIIVKLINNLHYHNSQDMMCQTLNISFFDILFDSTFSEPILTVSPPSLTVVVREYSKSTLLGNNYNYFTAISIIRVS